MDEMTQLSTIRSNVISTGGMYDDDNFISRLYLRVGTISTAEFKFWALDELAKALPFDSAFWAEGAEFGATIFDAHLHNSKHPAAEWLRDYASFKEDDPLAHAVFSNKGVTIRDIDLMPRQQWLSHPAYGPFCRKHQIEYALCTMDYDPVTTLVEVISLYRASPDTPFDEAERQRMQTLFPHLLEARKRNQQIAHGRNGCLAPFSLDNGLGDALTSSERCAARALIDGLSYKESAGRMGIAVSTFNKHAHNLYRKLGIDGRAKLMRHFGAYLASMQMPSQASTPDVGFAICNGDGMLYRASEIFTNLLLAEIPGWQGPNLPWSGRLSTIGRQGATIKGDRMVVVARRSEELLHLKMRPRKPLDELSPAELKVARELASGTSHKSAAQALGLSPSTVNNHAIKVYKKLGLDSKTALARWWAEFS